MKGFSKVPILLCFIAAFATNLFADNDLLPQRILYIGHRPGEFTPFLKQHFASVTTVSRNDFKADQVADIDVVLLDWPQDGQIHSFPQSPIGERANWSKPTVLLGSAGLNLAVDWKLKGGAGCTCLAPVAYGLKTNHDIFKTPIAIDVTTTNIPTPGAFVSELKTNNVDVVPLVNGIHRYESVINDYARGWCVYYYEFADVPEVEFFCGGINEKSPRASALWRQGNLLHFGFEQSPTQLNDAGKGMLVNAIVYISRFTEDRPIDITPSVFGKDKIAESRKRAKSYLLNHPDWCADVYAPETLASFDWRNHDAAKAWLNENGSWLHPGPEILLTVDTEAKSLGVPFDAPDFLPKTIASLRNEKTKNASANLLARYAPEGPGATAGVEAWEKWWKENAPYLFYSELGCYRWYIDPLAKKRGIPTKDLRGPSRAS